MTGKHAGLFNQCSNVFGKLDPKIRTRLERVIADPKKYWDDAHSIILHGRNMTTLWQAVIAVDPFFPRTGPRTDQKGNILEGWERFPDRDTVLKAILYVAEPRNMFDAQVYHKLMLEGNR